MAAPEDGRPLISHRSLIDQERSFLSNAATFGVAVAALVFLAVVVGYAAMLALSVGG